VADLALPFTVELFELHLGVDDPSGAISAHGLSGLWGLLAAGLFADAPAQWFNSASGGGVRGWLAGSAGQFLAQWVAVATLIGFILPLTYGLNWLLNHFYPQRMSSDGERAGADLHELGAGAYPEFLTHTEEFSR
jgi:Amt family ammonium transporter